MTLLKSVTEWSKYYSRRRIGNSNNAEQPDYVVVDQADAVGNGSGRPYLGLRSTGRRNSRKRS